MKRTVSIFLSLFIAYCAQAQHVDSSAVVSKFRFTLAFGIDAMNPDQINDRIATSNQALGSSAQSIKSMPEVSAALTIRPNQDQKILILRAGYLWAERDFAFALPETDSSSTPIGKVRGEIKETYSAYPFSIGIGLSTLASDLQVELDFIYAVGYITENGSYTTTEGATSSYTNTLFSPAYGFRIAAQTSVPVTPNLSIMLELAYRGLKFESYENQVNAAPSDVEFSMSGISGNIGITFTP
jgi:hypothetical protein